ncbi:MAG: phytoene desaturase [Rhizobacter sp.]|nr:phytoene desaturase [Chlorobiales bacterium]
MKKHIAIIGAGLGGLAAAMRLAYNGCRVSIYEKNSGAGGKMQEVVSPQGYRFDTGPTLLTMPFVFEHLFQDVGKRLADYLTLVPLEIPCRYHFSDGTVFNAYADFEKLTSEIETVFPSERKNFERYFQHIKKIYDITAESFIYNPLTLSRLMRVNPLDFFSIDAFPTAHETNSKFFGDSRFVQFLDRFPTYVGSSPYLAPATLNVIPFVELSFGGFYVQGGLYRVAEAYQKVCEELGVEFHFNSEVAEILIEEKKAAGLKLQDGQRISADAVISNDDAVHTYERLFGRNGKKIVSERKLKQLEASCSGFVLLLGVKREYASLNHHNIFFSPNYENEFREIFEQKIPPFEPTIYVSVSSKSDKRQSPAGTENWFVLVNAPYLTDAYDWTTGAKPYRDLVINRLTTLGFTDLEQHLEFEQILTPLDLKTKFNSNRGSIYGVTSNKKSSAFLRPQNRSPYLKRLYFASGSAHPGGGTPMVTLSGKFAAELVMQDLK